MLRLLQVNFFVGSTGVSQLYRIWEYVYFVAILLIITHMSPVTGGKILRQQQQQRRRRRVAGGQVGWIGGQWSPIMDPRNTARERDRKTRRAWTNKKRSSLFPVSIIVHLAWSWWPASGVISNGNAHSSNSSGSSNGLTAGLEYHPIRAAGVA